MPGITITLEGEFADMNTYIAAANRGRHLSAKVKESETLRVQYEAINRYDPVPDAMYPVVMTFKWFRKNAKVDPGNIAFGEKYISDGLQAARIIRGDGWNDIKEIHHLFFIDKQTRVEVVLSWDEANATMPKAKRSITKRI